jgi:galactokinase
MNRQEGAAKARQCFSENFSTHPEIYFSPGRINLIGEHIDYNDGFVMPAAIDKGIYFAVAPNNSNTINFYAADFNERFSVNVQEIKKATDWRNYVLGVLHEFMLLNKPVQGFDCAFTGDIPIGSGLSSSAAAEGGLAFALNELFQFGMNRVELALLCQRAEHNYPGVKCGIMDMYASLNGKKDHVLLLDCKNISHEYFPLELNGYKIVLLNSKVHHTLASGEYNVRRQRCEEGLAILKNSLQINSFRDIENAADIEPCKKIMTAEVYNCCKYVVEEISRTKKAALLLQQNDLAGFGELMYATHEGLRQLYKVSCAELDFLVEQVAADKNVIGARMMGGGFGGCTINIVKEAVVDELVEEVSLAYQKQFNVLPEAYVVETGDGTRKVDG